MLEIFRLIIRKKLCNANAEKEQCNYKDETNQCRYGCTLYWPKTETVTLTVRLLNFKNSILIRVCQSAHLLILWIGVLFVFFSYCFVWLIIIINNPTNDAGRLKTTTNTTTIISQRQDFSMQRRYLE